MKKILSTILTLTMLALPLAIQCSAFKTNYNINSSYSQNYRENKENQKNDKYNNNEISNNKYNDDYDIKYFTEEVEAKKDKCFFSKIGSFFLKALLFATVSVGATAALCKYSPNGELVTATKNFGHNTLIPNVKSLYSLIKEKAVKHWDSAKQTTKDFYFDTLQPQSQIFFSTTIPDTFNNIMNWISNFCVQQNVACNPNHYGSACNNNDGGCEKTLGQWTEETKEFASEKWNNFNDYCLIKGENDTCTTTIGNVTKTIGRVLKNNYDALFQSANISNFANINASSTNLSETANN